MLDNIMLPDYIDYVVEYDEDYEKDDIAYEDKVSEKNQLLSEHLSKENDEMKY